MQVFVRTYASQTIVIGGVTPTDSVDTLKVKILERVAIPLDDQRLIFAGKQLSGWRSIGDYHIQHASTLHLALRLRGGCPPEECCCCELHQGMRVWTGVFIVYLAVYAVMSVVGIASNVLYHADASAIAGSVLDVAVCAAQLVAAVWGLIGIHRYQSNKIRVLWRASVGLIVASGLWTLVEVIIMVSAAGSAAIFWIPYVIVPYVVYAALAGWYAYAARSLAQQIATGQISKGVGATGSSPSPRTEAGTVPPVCDVAGDVPTSSAAVRPSDMLPASIP